MTSLRLAFIFTWGLLMAFAQLPLFIGFTAVNFEPYTVTIAEILAAITTSIITALLVVKEEYNGKEIFRKE